MVRNENAPAVDADKCVLKGCVWRRREFAERRQRQGRCIGRRHARGETEEAGFDWLIRLNRTSVPPLTNVDDSITSDLWRKEQISCPNLFNLAAEVGWNAQSWPRKAVAMAPVRHA